MGDHCRQGGVTLTTLSEFGVWKGKYVSRRLLQDFSMHHTCRIYMDLLLGILGSFCIVQEGTEEETLMCVLIVMTSVSFSIHNLVNRQP